MKMYIYLFLFNFVKIIIISGGFVFLFKRFLRIFYNFFDCVI